MNPTLETPPTKQAEQTHLYYRSGSSDKVYQVTLEPVGDRFAVNFAYGRRGSTLNTGTKTSRPVEHAEARAIYDQLIREKTAKGYTPGPDGTPYRHTEPPERLSPWLPQLLNPVDESDLSRLLADQEFCLQEKLDGRRLLIQRDAVAIHGINRRGLIIGLPEPVFAVINTLPAGCVLDGESVGDVFHAFDLLQLAGRDVRSQPYQERYRSLATLINDDQALRLVPTAWRPADKARRLEVLRIAESEGVVFKRVDAPYTPGRPASGGDQFKYKFYSSLSAVVAVVNPQRSVALQLLSPAGWLPCGNVTIPPNHAVPTPGAVVEVRYLYCMPGSGNLYQPVYLGVRTDVEATACVTGQLKFKADTADV